MIAMIDDDKDLLSSISMVLRNSGFEVTTFDTGIEFLVKYRSDKNFRSALSIVLLDIMMVQLNGEQVLKEYRKYNENLNITFSPPVIMFTNDSSWQTNVKYKELGVVDYLEKSSPAELLIATINAKTSEFERFKALSTNPNYVSSGQLKLNKQDKTISTNEKSIRLTKSEYMIFDYIYKNRGHIADKEDLRLYFLGEMNDFSLNTRVIDAHVHNIRKKLLGLGEVFSESLQTCRGIGYIYKENNEKAV